VVMDQINASMIVKRVFMGAAPLMLGILF
jgi:hypothetical protein